MTKIVFNAQNIPWSDSMELFARETIERGMHRTTLNDATYTVKASIVNKKTKLIKVELSGGGFRAQCTGKDFYGAMTAVVSKFKSLVLKKIKKAIAKKRSGIVFDDSTSLVDKKINNLIFKEKIFVLEPYDVETAVKNFERTDYNFYIFRDIDDNEAIVVIYRRVDGTLGLIRCR